LGKIKLQIIMLIVVSGFLMAFRSIGPTINIAIIDTGIDSSHAFLQNQLWFNHGEVGIDKEGNDKAKNKIDDDGNGLVDDVNGWNFVNGSNELTDNQGHGTHIAGIIKGHINQTNPNVKFKFMVLKYFDKNTTTEQQEKAFLKALKYAIDKRVDYINISGGGYKYSEEELELLHTAQKKGISVVAAAGNKKQNRKSHNFYPAAYKLSNIYSVVATDFTGNPLETSNVNTARPNVYVPGERLYSSLPNNQFGYLTGSSQATAVLTAKLICQNPMQKKTFLQDLHNQARLFVSISSNLFNSL
jgi:thermitase